MRFLRAFFIALFTAVVGCVLAFFVGDYLTKLAHVPEMEGQRPASNAGHSVQPFLTAGWRFLAMSNYVVDPRLIAPLVPPNL